MPITDILEKNAGLYGDDVCLTEINPELEEQNGNGGAGGTGGPNWRESALVEAAHDASYRKELTWREFDEKANRFANLLIGRGLGRGDKVGVLLMNCIEWLPIYFGVLKSGATVVPLNFRYSSEEIAYALRLADVSALALGPEFVERVGAIIGDMPAVRMLFYVGDGGG